MAYTSAPPSECWRRQRVWLENAYSRPFLALGWFWGIWPPRSDKISTNVTKVSSTGHSGSSGILLMLVSVVIPEKQPGQKKVWRSSRRRRTWIFGRFWHLFKETPTWLFATFWCLCVHSVEDSKLIPIFDPYCLSLFVKGSPKFRFNRYT